MINDPLSQFRVQRRERCEHNPDDWFPIQCHKFYGFSAGEKCNGCNNDGTRWETIGEFERIGDGAQIRSQR